MKPVALTIAGSDPSGGAGIQADLKTFHQFGVYGEAVLTLLTVQNTVAVTRVECVAAELVGAQIEAVITDIPPQAAKTGALGNRENITLVATLARSFRFPLVVDPVMISKHGAPLLAAEAVEVLRSELLPRATLVTPNLPEAEALTGREVSTWGMMRDAAQALRDMTGAAVLVKGGHLGGAASDLLLDADGFHEFESPRVDTQHTHGTGCTYSAAITACLALGLGLVPSVTRAKAFIAAAIATNPGLGAGGGPVNHHASTLQ